MKRHLVNQEYPSKLHSASVGSSNRATKGQAHNVVVGHHAVPRTPNFDIGPVLSFVHHGTFVFVLQKEILNDLRTCDIIAQSAWHVARLNV